MFIDLFSVKIFHNIDEVFSFRFYFYKSNKLLDPYLTLILIIDTDIAIELFSIFAKFFDTLDLLSSTICIN